MKTTKAFLFIFVSLLMCSINIEAQQFKKLEQAYKAGAITKDEMILNKFYYMFDHSKVNKAFKEDVSKPIKCGTPLIREYMRSKSLLSKSTIDIIEKYLTITDVTTDYISSGEHFKISYTTTGPNAVPLADENQNGTPDYVEWIASYLETAWTVEITQCGFRGPVDTQGDGYYNISFENVNYCGATYPAGDPLHPIDGNEGTRIVLDNDFLWKKNGAPFPPNDDESDQKGTAKVTCAHEFKHASQYMYILDPNVFVSENFDWIELDATWAEELVFDYVNDAMLNYTGLGYGDPFYNPNVSLDVCPSDGFYGKYFWEDFLHQKFDNNSYTSAPIILALWQRIAEYRDENFIDTYDYVLHQFGSSLSDAFTEYAIWNYYTRSRAVPGFGYDEAGIPGFPEARLDLTHDSYPANGNSWVDHLAFNFIRLNPGGQSYLKTAFNGLNGPDQIEMNAVVTCTDGYSVFWDKIRLNSSNIGIIGTPTRTFGALIPVITKKSGNVSYCYTYSIFPGATVPTTTFTNTSGSSNLGGNLYLDGGYRVRSGSSITNMVEYSNHKVRTGIERLSDNKHHDWNSDFSLFTLSRDFQPQQGQNQNARFDNMYSITVKNLFEGIFDNLGNVNFHDPWYVDQSSNQSNSFYSFSSPYYPRGKYGETSGGIFLNQIPDPINPNAPFYSVRAPLTQDIYLSQTGRTHTFYFQNWSSSGAQTQQVVSNPSGYDQKAVVLNSTTGSTVTANFKGTNLSNTATAFSNNSQRKIVRTKDGWLHQVYESKINGVGRVWLEHSTNEGTTWFLGNNGQPIDNGAGKCPSIDWYYNTSASYNTEFYCVVVAYQQQFGSTYTIEYAVFNNNTNGSYVRKNQNNPGPLHIEPAEGDPYETTNANPNIAWSAGGGASPFALSFERKSTADGMQPGIYWVYGYMYEYGISTPPDYSTGRQKFMHPKWLDGTSSSSINATISESKSCTDDPKPFNIVYQDGTSSIKKVQLSCSFNGSDWVPTQGSTINLSLGTGQMNYQPTLIQTNNEYSHVCWIRSLNGQPQNSPWSVNVVYWNSEVYPWQYSIYGWNTRSVSINVRDDNPKPFFTFSQNNMFGEWENFASDGSTSAQLNTTGQYVQLSNGPATSSMFTSSFYLSTPINYFNTTSINIGGLSKGASSDPMTYGRGAVLVNGDVQFSYSLKSLIVDKTNIKFIDIPEKKTDTSKVLRHLTKKDFYYPTLESLNKVLLSEPFSINKNSSINISEQAGFIDTLAAIKALGAKDYVTYKLELVDNATNKTIGVIKESKFTSTNLTSCILSASNLKAGKIGTKTVRVRITLGTNIDGLQGALVNEYGTITNDALAKLDVNELTLQNSEIPTSYALNQNFPNPFNPSTTIRYQLPNAGHVMLKVYDMLGREVATLVDEMKETGYYSVKFDGVRLASGTYIVRITAESEEGKSFTQTKKMMLLK